MLNPVGGGCIKDTLLYFRHETSERIQYQGKTYKLFCVNRQRERWWHQENSCNKCKGKEQTLSDPKLYQKEEVPTNGHTYKRLDIRPGLSLYKPEQCSCTSCSTTDTTSSTQHSNLDLEAKSDTVAALKQKDQTSSDTEKTSDPTIKNYATVASKTIIVATAIMLLVAGLLAWFNVWTLPGITAYILTGVGGALALLSLGLFIHGCMKST